MLQVERLEDRTCYAAGVSLQNGILSVVGTNQADIIDVRTVQANTGPVVHVTLNDQTANFSPPSVTQIYIDAGGGDDDVSTFNVNIPAVIDGGKGDDMIQAGAANDVISNGEIVYDILGTNVLNGLGGKPGLFFSNAASTVLSDPADTVVRFFDVGRTPGSGSVQLVGGVLYLTPPDGGTSTQLLQSGKSVVLVSDWAGVQFFDKSAINVIAYFGGSGDDSYSNHTKITEVVYGGLAGNDTLTGGKGDFAFLKGGGGNDTIVGRAKRNDLAGNGGADVLVSFAGKSKLRADALDTVFSRPGDRLFLG